MKNKLVTHPILVVEDDSEDRELLIQLLTQVISNCEIIGVANGQEAIHYLETTPQLPSLVLLDIYMPLKNGFEVIREVKSNPALRTIPIIALTSSSVDTDIVRSYNLGVNAYLIKPSTEEGLHQLVQTIHTYWITNVKGPVYRRNLY
ncbi:response regulator [Cytophagaceae bacterium DM2B3-1]|uniref:Response regulator n=1 Tax=Xanthocytophaga flava TaxID=3048013 RepID=A0AAE3UA14_9BACT|nr:response regulator [Xanthocytophaga flavus]MDJ1473198.1 response regulator [Xanthocytophaga flavus]MDJ1484247.1 response regulator [Xanthocytophaga flavus]MDJ1495228.1 response regulator [Xanthocytophaga flavus]